MENEQSFDWFADLSVPMFGSRVEHFDCSDGSGSAAAAESPFGTHFVFECFVDWLWPIFGIGHCCF